MDEVAEQTKVLLLPETWRVDVAATWHERVRSYLGRSQEQVLKEFFFSWNNPCSDVRLNPEKSAEVIVVKGS